MKLRDVLITGMILAGARSAHAQGNAFGAPIGGRSALMGNTGVALGIDGAAPFLNPATIIKLDDHRFSFSVNFYSYSNSRFSNWHQPGAVDASQFGSVTLGNTGLTSSGFSVLPSTLCLFFTTADGDPKPNEDVTNLASWRQKLAICLGSSESQGVAFTALPIAGTTSSGVTTQSQSLVQSWSRLNVGPSYSIALSRRLAIGLSLHGVLTNESFILDSSVVSASAKNGGVQSSLGLAGGGNSFDLSAILGAIYSLSPVTLGASVSLPAVHALGSYTGTVHNEYSSGATANASVSNGTGNFSAAPPIRLAVGVGVDWPRLSLEVDESAYIPALSGFKADLSGTTATLNGTTLTSTPVAQTFSVAERVVVNTSVGAEYFVRKDVSLIGGLSFNLSALAPLAPTVSVGNLVQERQSTVTASAGVGTYTRGGALLLGLQVGYGWGESIAANPYVTPNELSVIDTSSYSVLLILAGSTSLKSLGHAIVRIENVVTGTAPSPEPPSGASGASAKPTTTTTITTPAPTTTPTTTTVTTPSPNNTTTKTTVTTPGTEPNWNPNLAPEVAPPPAPALPTPASQRRALKPPAKPPAPKTPERAPEKTPEKMPEKTPEKAVP